MTHDRHFTHEEIPYDELSRFGLTQEMIEDLPQNVLHILLHGQRTPLLPIFIHLDDGRKVSSKAKIQLMRLKDKVDVLFFPVLRTCKLNFFKDKEKEDLSQGKVIMTRMKYSGQISTCFVQIDPETNHIVYVPTHVIGKNLELLSDLASLTPEDIEVIKDGTPLTFEANGSQFTAGIALLSEFGIHLHKGDAEAWRESLGNGLRKFNFALHGCWIKDPFGALKYVSEDDYTDEMIQAMQRRADDNAVSIRAMQR